VNLASHFRFHFPSPCRDIAECDVDRTHMHRALAMHELTIGLVDVFARSEKTRRVSSTSLWRAGSAGSRIPFACTWRVVRLPLEGARAFSGIADNPRSRGTSC